MLKKLLVASAIAAAPFLSLAQELVSIKVPAAVASVLAEKCATRCAILNEEDLQSIARSAFLQGTRSCRKEFI